MIKKLSLLLVLTLSTTNTSFSEEKSIWGAFGRKKIYSSSKCMNNFKYCSIAKISDTSESKKEKGERDCNEFVQYCAPIFPDVCEALKSSGYDCGTPKDLKEKFLNEILEAIENNEENESMEKILEALDNKKQKVIEEKNIEKEAEKTSEEKEIKREERKNNPRKISLF